MPSVKQWAGRLARRGVAKLKRSLPARPVWDANEFSARALLGRSADQGMRNDGGDWVAIAERMMRSAEFALNPLNERLDSIGWSPGFGMRYASLVDLVAYFHGLAPPPTTHPGFYTDFLGVRTRTAYVPGLHASDGVFVGAPTAGQAINYDLAEWQGTLQSVFEAHERGRTRFVVAELGAGWGPWLVTAAAAARLVGIARVELAGVEADEQHFEFLLQHLRDNGIEPEDHFLFKGAIGVADGTAYFPVIADSTLDWGAAAHFGSATQAQDYRGVEMQHKAVPCLGLGTLLERYDRVDLLHCDIQDSETDVIPAAAEVMTERLRRLVIGTHSRRAEAAIIDSLAPRGWSLDLETPCRFAVHDRRDMAFQDGVQVWSNPTLA